MGPPVPSAETSPPASVARWDATIAHRGRPSAASTDPVLVRPGRSGSALASAGRLAVGRAGQRGHAPADPRGPRRAGLPGLAHPLADSTRSCRGAGRGGGAGVGPPRLPAPRAAAARGGHGDLHPPRWSSSRRPRRPAGPAGHRRLHRRGGGILRLRPAPRRPRHECPAGAGPGCLRAGPSGREREPGGESAGP
jgi:hypothetical protein